MSEEELEDEILEPGSERCPFCNEVNTPGEYQTCEHLFGFGYEGESLDGSGEKIGETWEHLEKAFNSIETDEQVKAVRGLILSDCHSPKHKKLRTLILESVGSDYLSIIEEVCECSYGESMGSDGSYLYIKDDSPRYELDYEVDDILEIINDFQEN